MINTETIKNIYMASFDIGKKNFAFYVEKVNISELTRIKKEKKKFFLKYRVDGTTTEEMTKLLNDIYKTGKTILHINSDLTENCDKKKSLDYKTFYNMNNLLHKYKKYWDLCSYIVIEKQMCFGRNKNNIMALKLGQHCYSYFSILYNEIKIYEFPAYHKTQILGAPKIKDKKDKYKPLDKNKRKKWAVKKAIEILNLRNEINIFDAYKKKDDLADTLIQLQAFKYLEFIL